MKILGMELYPKRKTDEEFIEQVRRSIPLAKRLALVHLLVVALWGGLLVVGFRWFLGVAREFEWAAVSEGLVVGLAFGLLLGFGCCSCFASVVHGIECFVGDRRAKLLVKFYDEAMKRGRDQT